MPIEHAHIHGGPLERHHVSATINYYLVMHVANVSTVDGRSYPDPIPLLW